MFACQSGAFTPKCRAEDIVNDHQPQTREKLDLDPDRLGRIATWMEAHVAAGRLPGLAVRVTHRGRVAFDHRTGLRDVAGGLPVEPDTVWRIYSMTKPVTSVAALMLYEEGAFQLDQPVADFLPEFRAVPVWKGEGHALDDTVPCDRPVTIHDLMTHQSGLVYGDPEGTALERACSAAGLDFGRPGDTMADAVRRLAALPLAFQPGARWFYGLSTDVLGRLVEVISGRRLGDFLADRIFGPLGMSDTGFALQPGQRDRLAALYVWQPGGFHEIEGKYGYAPPVSLESGGGGLVSTMDDYQRFASMFLGRGRYPGGRLLGAKTFDLMVSNHMGGDLASRGQAHFSETTFHGIGFGLGMSVMLDPAAARIVGSPGEFAWGGMASTAFWVDPAEELTVILMTQLVPSSSYALRRQLRVLTYQALV
jgi:CubicO group peptidase (beta-lactamase class C family)